MVLLLAILGLIAAVVAACVMGYYGNILTRIKCWRFSYTLLRGPRRKTTKGCVAFRQRRLQ
jgi:hypothetical protein